MAIYHLSAGIVSRGDGRSSTGKAAYNARCSIVDERTGRTHDYSRHSSRCIFEGIYAPKDAPEWTRDRAQLWNHVEAFEKHRNAQVARTLEIALPHELTPDQQRQALQDFVRDNFTRKGLIADVAIHEPGKDGDHRNTHAHIMFVTRKLDGSEFAKVKADRADSLKAFKEQQATELEGWRESWEKTGNRHLKRHGHAPTLDRRTLEAQGIDRTPGVHLGKAASEMEARGVETGRGDMQREAANQNQVREWIAERQADNDRLTRDDFARMQAENAARQDRERAGLEAEQRPLHRDVDLNFVPTLDGIKRREADAAEPGRGSMDAAAKRAMDDLAAVDPLGTARNFGHHRGDRLKSPEEMRTEWAATLRAASAPEPPEVQPVHQVDAKRDHLADRMRWAETLRGFDAKPKPVNMPQPEGQGRGTNPGGMDIPAPSPEATQRASYEVENQGEGRPMGFFGRLWTYVVNFGSPAMPRSRQDDNEPILIMRADGSLTDNMSTARTPADTGNPRVAREPDSGPVNAAAAAEARQAEAAREREKPKPDRAREAALLDQIEQARTAKEPDVQLLRDLSRQYFQLAGASPPITPTAAPTVTRGDDARQQQEAGTDRGREYERQQRRDKAREVGEQYRQQRSPLDALMQRVKAEQAGAPKATAAADRTRKQGGGRSIADDDRHDGRRHRQAGLRRLLHPFQHPHGGRDRHRKP